MKVRRRHARTPDHDRSAPASDPAGPMHPPARRCWDLHEFQAAGGSVEDGTRVSFGCLWLPVVNGMQVQFQLDEAEQNLLALVVVLDAVSVKLMPLAAPRSGGLWAQIRAEVAQQLLDQGGSAYEQAGPFGPELAATLPAQPGQAPGQGDPARFVGLEGPRWLLHAIIAGPAVHDPSQVEAVHTLLQHIVMVRGEMALPRGAGLPLTMPTQITEQLAPAATGLVPGQAESPEQPASPYRSGDFNPFGRGPEISEVR